MMKPDFHGKIPVDSKTANRIAFLARAQFDALENELGISVKPHDGQIEAPPIPDRDNLPDDLNRILERARGENWKIATLIERNFRMLTLDETYRGTVAKRETPFNG